MKSRKLLLLLAALAGMVAMVGGPSAASADTYAPGTDNQTFATSAGGWTNSTAQDGLCLPPLLCPAVTNSFIAAGGASGDGYIETDLIGLASTVAATSTGTWLSPSFAYNGNGGATPATAKLNLSVRPDIQALLGVDALNDATYRVDLVDNTTASLVQVLAPTRPLNEDVWAAIPAVNIDPAQLTVGHAYQIRIATTYHTVAAVIPNGRIGYDNVVLSTAGTGGGGNGGSGITTVNQLTQLVLSQGLPSSATLSGNKLRLKVKCPKQAAPKACRYLLRGLSKGKKSKPATKKKKTSIKAGAAKKVVITVKPKFLAKYQKAKKVTVKAKVSVGDIKATVTKKMKLIH